MKQTTTKPQIRKWDNGALRDSGDGKYDFFGFRHPLLEQSFGHYMNDHRKMPDGTIRDANNWWKGWGREISLQSMIRHVEDLTAIQAGYIVLEYRDEMGVHKKYAKDFDEANNLVKDWGKMNVDYKWITADECCNAIRFNSTSYLLDYLKNL
jgi:hypothetical protein